jgi:hypothetical protein
MRMLSSLLLGAALLCGACHPNADRSAVQPPVVDAIWDAQPRIITATDATSMCIGDPRTPLCALETTLACRVRSDPVLCDKVGTPRFISGAAWLYQYP